MYSSGIIIKQSFIINKDIKKIFNDFDKISTMKFLHDNTFKIILHGKYGGFKHIGICYVRGRIEEQENGCKVEYTIFPEVLCMILLVLYCAICAYIGLIKRIIDNCNIVSIVLIILPIVLIIFESRSQQKICNERLQYFLLKGESILIL